MGPADAGPQGDDVLARVKAFLASGEVAKARDTAQGHIAKHGMDPYGFISLGLVLKKEHRFKDATVVLGRAVELGPDLFQAWSNRGLCRALVGEIEGALADAEQALRCNPDDKMSKILKEKIRGRLRMTEGSPMPLVSKVVARERTKPQEVPHAGALGQPGPAAQQASPTETKYLAPELSQALVNEIENDKESILILVSKVHALKASVAALQGLTEMYEMDGVFVCADRPPRSIRKAFERSSRKRDLVRYIELMHGDEHGGRTPEADMGCPAHDLEQLMMMIEECLQLMADRHGGDDHFVLWDEVSSLRFYHEPRSLQRFFDSLAERLAAMGVVHVAVMARERSGPLQTWPGTSFETMLNAKDQWLMRAL